MYVRGSGPLIVADVPLDRVVSLSGVDAGELARSIASGGDELAPLVMSVPTTFRTPGAFASAAVADLERRKAVTIARQSISFVRGDHGFRT